MNATEAGVIKELLVKEEDTVTVGQDLVRIEVGAEPEKKASSESDSKPEEAKPESKADEAKPAESAASEDSSKETSAPAPKEPKPTPTPEPKKSVAPKPSTPAPAEGAGATLPAAGGREERRVRNFNFREAAVKYSPG